MIDLATIDDLARRLSGLVPPGLRDGRAELQQNFKAVLQAGLSRLDLVTREEFEAVKAVAATARAEQERLAAHVAKLEITLAELGKTIPPAASHPLPAAGETPEES